MTLREKFTPLMEAANFSREKAELFWALIDELDGVKSATDRINQELPINRTPMNLCPAGYSEKVPPM